MNYADITALLGQYGLKPNKVLGQHYLIDESILSRIIEISSIKEGELVLEIGAGPGILTKALAEAGAEVLAVEFDSKFCRLLQSEFHNWRNVHVLCTDALRLQLAELTQPDKGQYRKIVANIPYQITNPLIRKIIEPGSPIQQATLLVQKEVANRLTAPPGSAERGILTIILEYYGTIKKISDVPAAAFWPAPKVDSAIVLIERRTDPAPNSTIDQTSQYEKQSQSDQAFFWLIRQGFSGKRKVLINSLHGSLRIPKETVTAIVEKTTIPLQARAEDLSLAQWQELFEAYQASTE